MYKLHYADGIVSADRESFPKPVMTVDLEAGDHVIRLRHYYDPFPVLSYNPIKTGPPQWMAAISVQSRSEDGRRHPHYACPMQGVPWPTLSKPSDENLVYHAPDRGMRWGMAPRAPTKRVVLQRLRAIQVPMPKNGSQPLDLTDAQRNADAPGFVIWLDPAP